MEEKKESVEHAGDQRMKPIETTEERAGYSAMKHTEEVNILQ